MAKNPKNSTRTGANSPAATRHLSEGQKEALDLIADAEHTVGPGRTKLTRKIEKLGSRTKK
jgi:hypothetical protein